MATKIKPTDEIKDKLDIVFDLLGRVGVESFIVEFDGGGDDGQVEPPSEFKPFEAAKNANELLSEVVKGGRTSDGTRHGPNGSRQMWKNDPTLENMISNLCYDILGLASGGWEINEGSHGFFLFDVKKRKMNLDFNERVIEDNNIEFVL